MLETIIIIGICVLFLIKILSSLWHGGIVGKIIAITIILIFLGILIYKSPDETHVFKNLESAIEFGRSYACWLLQSEKDLLLKYSEPIAKWKIEESTFTRKAIDEFIQKFGKFPSFGYSSERKSVYIDWDIYSNLFPDIEEEKKRMELLALERVDGYYVMTFGYKHYFDSRAYEILEVPGKGKMLFSVAIRYCVPYDQRFVTKLIRKIANLPLLRFITGRTFGTAGKWVLFDYRYTCNLNDYAEWALKEGEKYTQKKIEDSKPEAFEKFLEELKTNKFIEEIEKECFFHGIGVMFILREQAERIRNLNKKLQEVEKDKEIEKLYNFIREYQKQNKNFK